MRKQTVIICKGLPGSGKTTFARKWVNEDPGKRVRVNRDDIRRMLGPYWQPNREELVTQIERDMLRNALLEDFDVVVDATNFKPEWIYMMLKNMVFTEKEIVVKDFTDVPIETCIERDKNRPKEEQVGEEVIRKFHEKYIKK